MIDQSCHSKLIGQYSYRINDQLGVGTFGIVYKGQNIYTNEPVAVKVISTQRFQNNQLNDIENEIKTLKLIGKNQNIVHLIDILQSSNHIYLIQEYCNSGDLREYLRKHYLLPESEALTILKQILNGFLEMEKKGIVHRDLKPENILLHNGVFKITDFGFSKSVDNFSQGMLSSVKGTPLYMAPQILLNEQYTSKCDVWSLGLIYYEILQGILPWKAQSQYELIQKINKTSVTFSNSVNISNQSKEFIVQCLQFQENERISFQGIFIHSLFGDCFNYTQKLEEIKNISQQIITELNQLQKQLTSLELFKQICNNNSAIKLQDFHNFLLQRNQELTREQCEFTFNLFDQNKDNQIDFKEFQLTLFNPEDKIQQIELPIKKYYSFGEEKNSKQNNQNFLYKSQRNKFLPNRISCINYTQEPNFYSPQQSILLNSNNSGYFQFAEQGDFLNQRSSNSNTSTAYSLSNSFSPLKKLFSCLTIDKDLLKKQFHLFDLDDDGFLSLADFSGLVNSTRVNLSEIEITEIFQSIDTKNFQKISFEQFFDLFKKNLF